MRTVLLLLSVFLVTQLSHAQLNDSTFVHRTVYSEAFEKDRTITVHLPSRYFAKPNEKMMVTYLLDAQGPQYFNMQVAQLDYLTSRYGIMPTIVVGIHSDDRYAEFTPFAREGNTKEWEKNFESKLPNLYEHLEKEVFPWVEANFRTKPFRAIVGHSRGGSFVIQCLFDGHKDLFDAYVAISPALQFDDFQSIDHAKMTLGHEEAMNKFLYTSAGDVGESEIFFADHVMRLDSVINNSSNPTLVYHTSSLPDKDHFTTVAPALNEAMILMKNEYMPSIEKIYEFAMDDSKSISAHLDDFIQQRTSSGQYLHLPSFDYYGYQASEFFEAENYADALDLFLWVERHGALTKWWNILNIGKCYAYLGKKKMGKPYLERSLIELEGWKEKYGEKYDQIKEDVMRQIEEISELK